MSCSGATVSDVAPDAAGYDGSATGQPDMKNWPSAVAAGGADASASAVAAPSAAVRVVVFMVGSSDERDWVTTGGTDESGETGVGTGATGEYPLDPPVSPFSPDAVARKLGPPVFCAPP